MERERMSESDEITSVKGESPVENPYARSADSFQDPPKGFLETLKHLGPGMILVGSIVGSGDNICEPIPGGAATCMDYINDQAQAIYDSKQ